MTKLELQELRIYGDQPDLPGLALIAASADIVGKLGSMLWRGA